MAKAKTATKSARSSDQPALSIPSPVRNDGDSKPNALDLLAAMKGKRQPAGKSSKSELVLELTPEAIEAVKDWVPAKILFDEFKSKLDAAKDAVDAEVLDIYLQVMWDSKSQPQNPKLRVTDDKGKPDMEGMFMVSERYSVQMPEIDDENDDRETVTKKMVALFVHIGLNPDKATQLVANEFIIRDEKFIALTELMEGKKKGKEFFPPTAVGKSAAEKLVYAIHLAQPLNLTDEEKEALIVTTSFKINPKAGFLNRVCTYCDTISQLKAVLKLMVKPVLSHKGAKIISGTKAEKDCRLISYASDVLGKMVEEDDDE